mmetsp:Transcript_11658/g.27533  ORF Transcript_11658/g.27533 Transcript_11658/m.27533 type:complete len:392 (+) Transcript_11658:315-1490(+)
MMINKAPAPAAALTMKLFFVGVLASVAVVKAERVRYPRPSDHQMEETQKDGEETVGRTSRRTTDPLADTASTASTPLKRSVSTDVSRPDPSPIAADDVPPETAEEASVDIGVLEAASVPAGTGRRLQTPTPCPAGYVNCVSGFVYGKPTVPCFDLNDSAACQGECCTDGSGIPSASACKYATACIEKNNSTANCKGYEACYRVGLNGASQLKISGGSCVGDFACRELARDGGEVGAISNSCTYEKACYKLARFFGTVGDISDSCNISDCCTSHCKFGDNPTIIGIACGLDIVSIATNTCPTSAPSSAPSGEPSTSSAPSSAPSDAPSSAPSGAPSSAPSVTPSTSSAPSFPPQGKSGKMAKSSKSGKVAAKSSKSPTTSKSSKSGKMAKAF